MRSWLVTWRPGGGRTSVPSVVVRAREAELQVVIYSYDEYSCVRFYD